MSGHNHYSHCTCGWCVNYGGRRVDRSHVLSDLRCRDAVALLERNAVRSLSACYVNPNARCPECAAAVYFYANQHGSRVYFDALGHPWPKHPCTDNPRYRMPAGTSSATQPLRRPRGLAQELVAAAGTAGLFSQAAGDGAGWRLLVVIAAETQGDRQVVGAESLDAAAVQQTFSYLAPAALIVAGDFVSMKGGLISFLNRETLGHVTFKNGAAIGPTPAAVEIKRPPPPVPLHSAAGRVAGKTTIIRRDADRNGAPDMTEAETAHFHSARVNVAQLCDRLGPVVKSYARSGTRKPPDVATRLNKDGHKTAAGAPWTPRLARFLLALIFSDPSARKSKEGGAARPAVRQDRPPAPLTPADLAIRLSKLGRVIVKGN